MINYLKKNIVTVDRGAIIHGCNCLGVMGAGVAKAIKERWPLAYEEYRTLCYMRFDDPESLLGSFQCVPVDDELVVYNLFSQVGYQGTVQFEPSANLKAIHSGLDTIFRILSDEIEDHPFLREVYMPKIGCGLGGLVWDNQVELAILDLSYKYTSLNINVCDI